MPFTISRATRPGRAAVLLATSAVMLAGVGLATGPVAAATPATGPAASSIHTSNPPVRFLDPVFDTYRLDEDLRYGRVKHDDGTVEPLRLNLYRPRHDPRPRRPVVIFIHGGDSSIDKGAIRNRTVPRGFVKRGFVSASLNYRDGTNGALQDAQDDIRAAVRWFRANADRYRVNPRRIVLLGSSAGAVGALQVAFNPERQGHSGHPRYSNAVAAGIAVSGTDYQVLNIGPDEVPIAMFHADDDTIVPIAAAIATCRQDRALGNFCRFFEYPAGGHPPGFLVRYRLQITEQASGFICRQVLVGTCAEHAGD